MTRRTLVIFAAVTLVVAVAAILVQGGRLRPTPTTGGTPLFPDLAERINDVRKITVTRAGESFAVERAGDIWAVVAKDGYPARLDAVRKTLIGLAELKTFEAKTRTPDLYGRLQVEDAGAKAAKSTRIEVSDASGAVLAALIVGKRHFSRGGTGPTRIYVRKPDDGQAWLAEGEIELGETPLEWTDKRILDVARERIRRIALSQPDGKRLVIEQAGAPENFRIADLPAGATPISEGDVNARASALAGLVFEDVVRADGVPFATAGAGTAEFLTRDGLALTMTMARHGDKTWLTVAAEVDEAAREVPAAAGEREQGGDESPSLKPLDEVRQEAAQINARAGGWAYAVPSYKLDYLRTRLSDLIEPQDRPEGGAKAE